VLFGVYYLGAALDDMAGRPPVLFYKTTCWGRAGLSLAFAALVATGQCEVGLLWLAAVNLWSGWALHRALSTRKCFRNCPLSSDELDAVSLPIAT
jgi:hypothetical protein